MGKSSCDDRKCNGSKTISFFIFVLLLVLKLPCIVLGSSDILMYCFQTNTLFRYNQVVEIVFYI